MADLSGRNFGPYRILEPLGAGGMAVVYKAYQPSMERHVALKMLPPELAEEAEFVGRFRQEARLLAQLQHPHILPVFDFGEHDGALFLVMPYVGTGTLEDLMRGQRLTAERATRLTAQIAEALDYAHSRGLVHRDIKPSNILIDERGNCLLTDFGIAKMYESTAGFTSTGGIIGTPSYMSPEQGQGEKLDQCSDIYSLGVLFFEMVTGQVPFTADTPIAVVLRHITDPLPRPRDLNSAIPEITERVIFKATAKNPRDRFQTARQMINALHSTDAETIVLPDHHGAAQLAKHRDGQATALETPPASAQAAPASPAKWLMAGAALLIVVVLIAALVISPSLNRRLAATTPSAGDPIVSGAGGDEPLDEQPVELVAQAPPSPTPTQQTPTVPATAPAAATDDAGVRIAIGGDVARTELTDLSEGQTVTVEVLEGGWRAGPAPVWPAVGAEGDAQTPQKASFPVPSAALMTLIGGVGDSAPFVVQPGRPFRAPQAGTFWLGPNDDDTSDNEGMLQIALSVGPQEQAGAEVAVSQATPSSTPTSRPTSSPTAAVTAPPLGPEMIVIGQSAGGQPLEVVRFGNGANTIVFVGGIHAGFAPSAVRLAQMAVAHFEENPGAVPATSTVYVVLNLNPDSRLDPGFLPGRLNDNGVDLNRNWNCGWERNPEVDNSRVSGAGGSAPFSEPETQALSDFLLEREARAVVFWEARAVPGMVIPGACGPTSEHSNPLAITYARPSGYRWQTIENMSAIDVAGDASNWLDGQGIPTVFALMPSFTDVDWDNHLAGMLAVIREYGR